MSYVLTFCIGGFLGFMFSVVMTSSSYVDKIQEAYETGYKKGLKENEK